MERWLHGEEVSPEDMRDLRTIGVTEKINKNNAFKMLRSLCQAVRALGYTGLALLFDEGDRMLSIGGKAEKTATTICARVIDRCREDLPGALFMYAVPPDFLNTVVPKYPALQQRVQAANYFSQQPLQPADRPRASRHPDEELLEQIGYRLLPIFELAYGAKLIRRCKPPTSMRSLPRQRLLWLSATAASSLRRWSLSGIARRKRARWR